MTTSKCSILTIEGAASLLETLHDRGYRVIGPTLREQAIVYDDVTWIADLPSGWTDEQDRGHYGLKLRLCGRAAFVEEVFARAGTAPVACRRFLAWSRSPPYAQSPPGCATVQWPEAHSEERPRRALLVA